MKLRVHGFLPCTYANGPGARAALWLQGCNLGCRGCFNGPTHDPSRGSVIPVDELLDQLRNLPAQIEGLTVSGGEPLQQLDPLTKFLKAVKATTKLSVIVLTGYSWSEVLRLVQAQCAVAVTKSPLNQVEPLGVLRFIDVIIAGRFRAEQRLARSLRGSANKTIHCLTDRYTARDFEIVPMSEVVITTDGTVVRTGVDVLQPAKP
jgi:anaerobic ribonucleoside-triphosphate reductase activating protein